MKDKIFIFDTTLRDGEQSPGASMNISEKVRVAHQLEKLNVDIIEAGFPVSSRGDFEAVKAVAKEVKNIQVAALARANTKDIDRAAEALKAAKYPCIHIFLATSDIHLKYKLKKSREEVLKMAAEAVKYARRFTDSVEFSAEDASRSDLDFVCKVFASVIKSGATVLNFPDTVGYAVPDEFGQKIKYVMEHTTGIEKARLSVHCHNDLGLAVANSLSAIAHGARQVEVTINGIGERAGNAALEEVVMAIRTRADALKVQTDIVTEHICASSRLVTMITGIPVQPNKAIVGANAFAHEAGIHQDGVLKERTTYEIMNPCAIGLAKSSLVMGKHSGRHAFKQKLKELGYKLGEADIDRVFERFKDLSDKKKTVFDDDIEALITDEIFRGKDKYQLVYLGVVTGTEAVPTATVQIDIDGELQQEAEFGVGPIDATFNAITKITSVKAKLLRFSVNSITGGTDAQGEVTVRLEEDGQVVIGQGADADIIIASAKAYLNALNRLEYLKRNPVKSLY
ncbi:MAG: 2-isopropylmalate synthase [Thermodesulfobacteriota bacterium]|nr:2-isopropylmalate synthase [Thermodesulfobacteriota bacterium]